MSNMNEDWKDIPGYEGLYAVSNNGRVMNVRSGRILKEHITEFGYKRIGIYKNGVCRMFMVHRLVAQAFLPNPDNLPEVNHKMRIRPIIELIILNGVIVVIIIIMAQEKIRKEIQR